MKTDILVIGSGIAGFSFALKLAKARPDLEVCIFTKSFGTDSNTRYAQGGIAVVLDKVRDSFRQHIEDTLKAGGGRCDSSIVEMVVSKAPERLEELMAWGVEFDRDASGQFDAGLEGGHSCPRILHHQDITGEEIEQKLFQVIKQTKDIKLFPHHMALDLICSPEKDGKACLGAWVLDQKQGQVFPVYARVTMLATGGSGQVYSVTTNPRIATGDGVAMAYRAGAAVRDMQFVQFHPTALFMKGDGPAFLISEAVRGYGAYLIGRDGRRFVFDTDERGELATRDIVSSAIFHEMKHTGAPCVYMDCRHLETEGFLHHFPSIFRHCLSAGIDMSRDLIPVHPAAHYQCGGIAVDRHGRTTIPQLYAIGECAGSGLHGTNRLASNSLLEAIVFSHEACADIVNSVDYLECIRTGDSGAEPPIIHVPGHSGHIRQHIRTIMDECAGVVKTLDGLTNAKKKFAEMVNAWENGPLRKDFNAEDWEIWNMLTVGRLIIEQSLADYRAENNPEESGITKKLRPDVRMDQVQ